MDPMDRPQVPEWTEEDRQALLQSRLGERLREHLIQRLASATGDSHNANAPILPIVIGTTKVPVTSEEKREAGVHANGRAYELEQVLAAYFGGVP